jgi:hypothetical protein
MLWKCYVKKVSGLIDGLDENILLDITEPDREK